MASRLNGQGTLFAVDINEGWLRILKETAKLHQVIDVISTIHVDLRTFSTDKVVEWDKVLLDAPCSGLGVLSKVVVAGTFEMYISSLFAKASRFALE
ncbi:PREDICTED: uncharacterized protein LOC109225514 isoform X5 [Nicotiana attenuata]|uniref:uncharacterized protein LOC109225514 isoform X5 n=1 Tax=Nicotiana attenuata TaxID=49451 RepID=UPI000904D19C|nr:PREDICTED: uncharacterized protein LOC109225514 isoform X5 [Nicotiana attenuata]